MIWRRHSGSYSTGQDSALRAALFAAAESVEPADDGLARIRSKITEGQAGKSHWHFGVRAPGESWWRSLLPPQGWLPAVAAAVVNRFRPDPNKAGWFGWMRPAAAVGTGLFVVTAASWAVAALPAAISPSNGTTGSVKPSAPTKTHHPKHSGSPGFTSSGSGSTGPSGQSGGKQGGGGPAPSGTASCSPSGSQSATPSGSPSTSGTPTDGGSPSPSDSSTTPTGTPSSSDSTTPASQGSSSSSPSPGAAPSSGASGSTTDPASVRQFGVEAVRATLVGGTTPSASPTPAPAGSPTVGGPQPTPTSVPTSVPPNPCA